MGNFESHEVFESQEVVYTTDDNLYSFPDKEELLGHFHQVLPQSDFKHLYDEGTVQLVVEKCANERKHGYEMSKLIVGNYMYYPGLRNRTSEWCCDLIMKNLEKFIV